MPKPAVDACPDMSGLCATPQRVLWTAENMPDLKGKRALVTGAAAGLGLATVKALAEHGANIIIADINSTAGNAAVAEISAQAPGVSCEFRQLDLADLATIQTFSQNLCAEQQPLDLLINNAGIFPPAQRTTTKDGFELKFGINYLGHFALTAQLVPALLLCESARVVNISSITQAWGKIDFDDLQAEQRYVPNKVYAQAKLAALMFGLELQQRAQSAGCSLQSMVAHPGIARTAIGQERKTQQRSLRDRMEDGAQALAMRFFGQSPAQGVLPILYAATAQEAKGGGFYGPDGFGQFAGYPVAVKPSAAARDAQQRARLWQASEKLTGQGFSLG